MCNSYEVCYGYSLKSRSQVLAADAWEKIIYNVFVSLYNCSWICSNFNILVWECGILEPCLKYGLQVFNICFLNWCLVLWMKMEPLNMTQFSWNVLVVLYYGYWILKWYIDLNTSGAKLENIANVFQVFCDVILFLNLFVYNSVIRFWFMFLSISIYCNFPAIVICYQDEVVMAIHDEKLKLLVHEIVKEMCKMNPFKN